MTILDVLDELTKERKDHIVPRNDDGTLGKAHKVTVKPLLVQIREATYPSGEQNGGTGSLPATRSVLDVDALHLHTRINAFIRAWCYQVNVTPTQDGCVDLRRWFVMWDSLNPDEAEQAHHLKMMRSWVRAIRDHLDPPKRFTDPGPCPVCGGTEWGDQINGGGQHPIEISYRLTEDGSRYDEKAICRRCAQVTGQATVWEGYEAVKELADELAEKRQA